MVYLMKLVVGGFDVLFDAIICDDATGAVLSECLEQAIHERQKAHKT
jgi:hypothetical protein